MMWTARNKLLTLGILIACALFSVRPAYAANVLLGEVKIDEARASALKKASLQFTHGKRTWKLAPAQVRKLYRTRVGGDGSIFLQLRPDAIYSYLNVHISPAVNDTGKQSRFVKNGDTTVLIEGGRKGTIVDGIKTSLSLRSALAGGKASVPVSMKAYRPSIFSASDFEKLKFPAQLAVGETNFAGSPRNRVHNIVVGTEKFNGIVIMPGEEFSFNAYLGEVDEANGYLPELVIKDNTTTPEFGGGICQVSTTAFRAAMQSGLEITYRRNHSYPVAYYGAPGYDATVYQPAPDFRFKNDMKTPVLLKTSIIGSRVRFEVWGTSDGRVVKINGPFTTEKKPDGSLTAAIAQIVTRAGQTIREANFVSKYQSPDKFPEVTAANGE